MTDQGGRTELTRRQALGAAGLAGAGLVLARNPFGGGSVAAPEVASAAAVSCVMTPEKTIGPYFVDELLNRSDIRANADGSDVSEGVALSITLTVVRFDDSCAPAEGVVVDMWHANAHGKYSDEAQNNTVGQQFLRGYQVTDENGQVTFQTVYPGWYSGRTIHVHVMFRTFDGSNTTYEFTSQLFFDQTINNNVQATTTYDGSGTTTNSQDNIYGNDTEVLVPLSGSVGNGFTGAVTIGLSGLPETGDDPVDPTDSTVDGTLDSVSVKRIGRKKNRRAAVAELTLGESATVGMALTRNGNTMASSSTEMSAGSEKARLAIERSVASGPASLVVTIEDAVGNVASYTRTVVVPERR